MFPSIYAPVPPHNMQPPGQRPLLSWPCLTNSSAAVELLQLAQRSKERAEALGQTRPELPSSPPTSIPRDLTTSPGSSYKPYLKFSVNAILARGEDGEEEVEDKKVVLKSSSREEKDHGGSPSPSLSPPPAPYPSSSPPLSPIVTQGYFPGSLVHAPFPLNLYPDRCCPLHQVIPSTPRSTLFSIGLTWHAPLSQFQAPEPRCFLSLELFPGQRG